MRALSSRLRSAASCLLVASVVAMAVGPASAQQGGISPEAKEHFVVGVELLKDPDGARYADAYVQFKLAYEKSNKSWKVLGNLALCAMKIERDGEAIEYYEAYLAQGGKELDESERGQIERDLRVLKSSVARVTLTSDTANAQVTDARQKTNGSNVTVYPFPGKQLTLGLHSGHHTLTARAGGRDLEWVVDLTPGQTAEHTFKFNDKPAVVPVPPPAGSAAPAATSAPANTAAAAPPPPTEPPGTSPLRIAGYATAGVGGAMLIGGVVTGLLASSKYNTLTGKCVNNRCPDTLQSDKDSVNSLATITNVLLIGGGVLAAGGLTMVLVAPSHSPTTGSTPSLRVAPSAWAGGGGLFANGTF
jgi:hypothetical protein